MATSFELKTFVVQRPSNLIGINLKRLVKQVMNGVTQTRRWGDCDDFIADEGSVGRVGH